jgi:glycosyltransferase involved in cell wall biosynthesis
MHAPRLLILSHDVVGSRMAGPGIRAWELARVLARQHPVTLAAPRPVDRDAPFATASYSWGERASLAPLLARADVVLANGHCLAAHPELAALRVPLALDLYDPTPLENLEIFRTAPPAKRAARAHADQTLLQTQLRAADFIACATERQRDLYLGALLVLGRVAPTRTDIDPQLRGLIDVVPFGLPEEPPVKRAPALRGVLPGISERDPLLLWTGGLWDWLDPQTLVRAMAEVVARQPDVRLVFLAGTHPGSIPAMRAPAEARALAEELGLLGANIFFYDEWVPYEHRADVLLEADIAVSLHRAHLETAYAAVRSRFLDHLWAGLPSIVSDGDAAAELVKRHALGAVVPPENESAVADAILSLLENERGRRECATRASELAAAMTWERAITPLVRFCARPTMTADRSTASEQPNIQPADAVRDYQAKIAALDQVWKVVPQDLGAANPLLGEAKRRANSLTRWYVEPVIAQQNAFNAATVHALQALAEVVTNLAADHPALARLLAEQPGVRQTLADIEQHLSDLDDAQTVLARRIAVDERGPE